MGNWFLGGSLSSRRFITPFGLMERARDRVERVWFGKALSG